MDYVVCVGRPCCKVYNNAEIRKFCFAGHWLNWSTSMPPNMWQYPPCPFSASVVAYIKRLLRFTLTCAYIFLECYPTYLPASFPLAFVIFIFCWVFCYFLSIQLMIFLLHTLQLPVCQQFAHINHSSILRSVRLSPYVVTKSCALSPSFWRHWIKTWPS